MRTPEAQAKHNMERATRDIYTHSPELDIANEEFEGLNLGWRFEVLVVFKEPRNKNIGGLRESYWILVWGTGCTYIVHYLRTVKLPNAGACVRVWES